MKDSPNVRLWLQLVLVLGLVLGGVYCVTRIQSVALGGPGPVVQPRGAAKYYQQRVRATERLLDVDGSGSTYGQRPVSNKRIRRTKLARSS